jgi:hypothetical protein
MFCSNLSFSFADPDLVESEEEAVPWDEETAYYDSLPNSDDEGALPHPPGLVNMTLAEYVGWFGDDDPDPQVAAYAMGKFFFLFKYCDHTF